MRQRLLLVAGWVVAAVATGLVSAGAVAVAGGQVTDRPLRPLSVAEVAALPDTIEDDCALMERLASGGFTSTRCPDREADDRGSTAPGFASAQPAEKESLGRDEARGFGAPIPSGDLSPSPDDSYARSPDDVEIPALAGWLPSEPTVIDLRGGRVSLSLLNGAIILNSATPRPGYVADQWFDSRDELTVTFWNGSNLSRLVATVLDGDLDLDSAESYR